ncbi:MAG: DNA repair protein RecN [Ignavibacteria bacterium]
MLKSLFIKNYALIDELEVAFSNGLVILTGETGAGKSIIIDALGLILGERASTDIVRTGAEKAIVEATFDIGSNAALHDLFKLIDLDVTHDVILRREVSAKGTTRCLVNDSAITLALMKKIGELLVDLHGQHEHQSLLRPETHIAMLDEYAGVGSLLEEYRTAFHTLRKTTQEIAGVRDREARVKEKLDLYTFQMQEIDAVAPQPGEDEQIETELKILENAEKLVGATGILYDMLYESENSVHDQLSKAAKQLEELARIDPRFDEQVKECRSAEASVNELAAFVRQYSRAVEFNPDRLERLRQRLLTLNSLKRKYGGTLAAVLAHRELIGNEAALAEHFDEALLHLQKRQQAERMACAALAEKLSQKRRDLARTLDKQIVAELATLGIPHARFFTRVRRRPLTDGEQGTAEFIHIDNEDVRIDQRGCDEVEFFISTNLGEEVKPLTKVASGGEVSRIMLALKSILAKSDRLPVLIFDEIDTGVSGRIAQAVGWSLKNLSRFHQIIAITHLPQIAGLADEHFVVEKKEEKKPRGGRATTSMRKLTVDERVLEVAKLMSGAEVTEAGLAGARELMGLK